MTNDLASLFPRGDGQEVRIRQGTIVSWNSSTGDNVVSVGGAEITNLPFEIASSVVLSKGDVVQLMSAGGKWFITGKVTDPGEADTVPTWPGDIANLNDVVVPGIQANVTAAQSTADTAQSTANTAQTTAVGAAADASTALSTANAAQATAVGLQTDLDAAEAAVAAAQADLDTLNDTTLPALQTQVSGILPITETDISDDAITTPKIAANAVTASEIAALAVTTAKLDAGAVTAAKIAAGTITANEIQAGAITATSLSADAVNGKTITGATLRTAATGRRVAINDPAYPGEIVFFSGNPDEVTPGRFRVDQLSNGFLNLRSPDLLSAGTNHSDLTLSGYHDGTTKAQLVSSDTLIQGTSALELKSLGTIKIGDGTNFLSIVDNAITGADLSSGNTFPAALLTASGSQTVTNKDISSTTNTFPTFPYYYAYLASTPTAFASGNITVATWATDGSPNSSGITYSAGNFTVPTAGRYRITVQLWWAGVASGTGTRTVQVIRVSPNTTLVSKTVNGSAVTTVPTPTTVSKTVRLSANEQIFVRAAHTSAVSTSPTGSNPDITYAQIEWVGP